MRFIPTKAQLTTKKGAVAATAAVVLLGGGAAALASADPLHEKVASITGHGDEHDTEGRLFGPIAAPSDKGEKSDAEESATLKKLAKIPDSGARSAVTAALPGATIQSVRVTDEGGSVVYQVGVTDASGTMREAFVDAGNGSLLALEPTESGDDAEDESQGGTSKTEPSTSPRTSAPSAPTPSASSSTSAATPTSASATSTGGNTTGTTPTASPK